MYDGDDLLSGGIESIIIIVSDRPATDGPSRVETTAIAIDRLLVACEYSMGSDESSASRGLDRHGC